MRRIDAAERRARIGRRHRLAPGERAGGPAEATRSIVCLHGTDPATIYLSAHARVEAMTLADLESALYAERSLVKHMAMRGTLFVFPRETMGIAQAGASERVAAAARRRLVRDVERAGLHPDGERWLTRAEAAVTDALTGGREATSTELRAELSVLEGAISVGEGRSWAADVPIGPRVLTVLSAAGRIVRASNDGAWTASRPRWASMADWLGADLDPPDAAAGVAGLVREWLRAFGPGTAADIKWWLGQTVAAVRRALADVAAVEVDLGGETGYVLPGDDEPTVPAEPWAALLPGLDPLPMGWKERGWFLGAHAERIFDSNGNAGPSVWWDGRIVGGWRQDEAGGVDLQLLEDVGADARAAIEAQAERVAGWLGGTRVLPRFPSPLWKTAVRS